MLSTTITFVFAMFILRLIRLLSPDSSCSICCSSCVFLCKRIYHWQSGDWLEIFGLSSRPCSPSLTFWICSPVLPWTAWVRWCPPVLLLSWVWFSHSLCADVLSLSCPYIYVFQDFYVYIFYSLLLQWWLYCLGLFGVKCSTCLKSCLFSKLIFI